MILTFMLSWGLINVTSAKVSRILLGPLSSLIRFIRRLEWKKRKQKLYYPVCMWTAAHRCVTRRGACCGNFIDLLFYFIVVWPGEG